MPKSATHAVRQIVRHAVENRGADQVLDRELLRLFTTEHDGDAFRVLVQRHGAMVWNVCRGLVRNDADAEDAFQATFLVLARRAGSIRDTASLASWLHGVAYRVARKAQAEFARRQKHEPAAARPEAAPPDDISWREVQAVLHTELSAISERYSAPLVLCYLQGKTQDEAATLLGLSKNTLKDRLERGRFCGRVLCVAGLRRPCCSPRPGRELPRVSRRNFSNLQSRPRQANRLRPKSPR